MEDGVLTGGPPNADGVMGEAPSETAVGSLFSARHANARPHMPRLHDQLMLGSYVARVGSSFYGHGGSRSRGCSGEIINSWSPFNKRESLVTHMRDLYPTLL